MCVSPTTIYIERGPYHERVEAACGWCWSCQKNKINDLVARCLCEASTSDWVIAITLTYRPHDKPLTPAALQNKNQKIPTVAQSTVIHKQDFQNFQKHLRRRFKTRYLVAGEYGSKGTARAHFHVILFGLGSPPSWELNKNTHIDQWPWGHVYVDDQVSEQAIRYCVKYLTKGAKRHKTKDDNAFNKTWISYSRIPIMGVDFVIDLAARYAAEKVYPHSFKYRPPFAHDRREYQFIGEARNVFFDALYDIWPEARDARKTEKMEKAHLRYIKDRQRRAWEALPPEEMKKYLDLQLKPNNSPSYDQTRLYGRFLYERWQASGIPTLEQFAEEYRDDYNVARAVYRRDLVAYPPTYEEARVNFAA